MAYQMTIARQIETGTVWIDQNLIPCPNAPSGGYKHRRLGVENGLEVLLEYVQPQTAYLARTRTQLDGKSYV